MFIAYYKDMLHGRIKFIVFSEIIYYKSCFLQNIGKYYISSNIDVMSCDFNKTKR